MEPGDEFSELIRNPRLLRGLAAPLFDRLTEAAAETGERHEPYRVQGRDELLRSVIREVRRLLNTRLPAERAATAGAGESVIHYGIPEFAPLSASGITDRRGLGELVARKIERFEPRLCHVRVEFEPDPHDAYRLRGSVQAELAIGPRLEPVSFPLQEERREAAGAAEPAGQPCATTKSSSATTSTN